VKNILLNADCIHVTSPKEIRECNKFGIKKPCTIISNGINPDHFCRVPEPEVAEKIWPVLTGKTVILFLSRLSPQKGIELLLPAWNIIRKRFPNAFLVIAGSDYMGYSREVHNLVKKSDYPNSILLTGDVKKEKKLALYSRANLFILPSYTENFGNVVAEALMCETPVITTQSTPWQELEKMNCGRWVPVSQYAIVQALTEMLKLSEKERKIMGGRGRKLILENYTWDIAARKMMTVYKAIAFSYPIPLCPNP
jgi:glycosyltransferase involved in cell wall biosynthesis